jgi:hypothetical protein
MKGLYKLPMSMTALDLSPEALKKYNPLDAIRKRWAMLSRGNLQPPSTRLSRCTQSRHTGTPSHDRIVNHPLCHFADLIGLIDTLAHHAPRQVAKLINGQAKSGIDLAGLQGLLGATRLRFRAAAHSESQHRLVGRMSRASASAA